MSQEEEKKIEGKGKMYYKTGDIYEGEFKNDLKDGKGKIIYNNGDIFIGEFKKDLKEGNGKMIYKNEDNENRFTSKLRVK